MLIDYGTETEPIVISFHLAEMTDWLTSALSGLFDDLEQRCEALFAVYVYTSFDVKTVIVSEVSFGSV